MVSADRYETRVFSHTADVPQLPWDPVTIAPELSARHTTLRAMLLRARKDLGRNVVVEPGFRFSQGLLCQNCNILDRHPFRLDTKSADCPLCGGPRGPSTKSPLSTSFGGAKVRLPRQHADPFWDATLLELGVPLFDVISASVYDEIPGSDIRQCSAKIYYELSGDREEVWEGDT